jgi:hypothetical protein
MGQPPIDLNAAWERHKAATLADRDDGLSLHASDLHSCAFALHQRLSGVPQLPHDDGSFANFERGHAFEARFRGALCDFLEGSGLSVLHGGVVRYEGITGNPDFTLYRTPSDEAMDAAVALLLEKGIEQLEQPTVAVIDVTTTAGKTTAWSYGHALKSAFYAVAEGCDTFCEFVVRFGFGGTILGTEAHWFHLDEQGGSGEGDTWREEVAKAIVLAKYIQALAEIGVPLGDPKPPLDPLSGEFETWRCGKAGKSYCRCVCPLNGRGK